MQCLLHTHTHTHTHTKFILTKFLSNAEKKLSCIKSGIKTISETILRTNHLIWCYFYNGNIRVHFFSIVIFLFCLILLSQIAKFPEIFGSRQFSEITGSNVLFSKCSQAWMHSYLFRYSFIRLRLIWQHKSAFKI